jgi:parvulin-like peptidyl-prolyl isomerase
MPADFMAAVEQLTPGKRSPVTRTLLGFHILELTDAKPGRALAFEEVREEITATLKNEQRAAAVGELAVQFGRAEFLRR